MKKTNIVILPLILLSIVSCNRVQVTTEDTNKLTDIKGNEYNPEILNSEYAFKHYYDEYEDNSSCIGTSSPTRRWYDFYIDLTMEEDVINNYLPFKANVYISLRDIEPDSLDSYDRDYLKTHSTELSIIAKKEDNTKKGFGFYNITSNFDFGYDIVYFEDYFYVVYHDRIQINLDVDFFHDFIEENSNTLTTYIQAITNNHVAGSYMAYGSGSRSYTFTYTENSIQFNGISDYKIN